MLMLAIGVFIVLHGLVHLLYVGQSLTVFELQRGMTWPDNAWTLSVLADVRRTRGIASAACVLAALGLVTSGASLLLGLALWQPVLLYSTIVSGIVFVAFWDGRMHRLAEQGGIGLLIDLVTLIGLLTVIH